MKVQDLLDELLAAEQGFPPVEYRWYGPATDAMVEATKSGLVEISEEEGMEATYLVVKLTRYAKGQLTAASALEPNWLQRLLGIHG